MFDEEENEAAPPPSAERPLQSDALSDTPKDAGEEETMAQANLEDASSKPNGETTTPKIATNGEPSGDNQCKIHSSQASTTDIDDLAQDPTNDVIDMNLADEASAPKLSSDVPTTSPVTSGLPPTPSPSRKQQAVTSPISPPPATTYSRSARRPSRFYEEPQDSDSSDEDESYLGENKSSSGIGEVTADHYLY